MNTKFLRLCLFAFLLSACSLPSRAAVPTVEVSGTTPPTIAATQPGGQTPTTEAMPSDPQPTSAPGEPTTPLSWFPLNPGASWVYAKVDYSQPGSDPNARLQATTRIEERVIDVANPSPYYFAHLQRNTTLVSADPGWLDTSGLALGNSEFWYVLLDGRVYRSVDQPDPDHLAINQLSEELVFPLMVGSSWCPNKIQKGSLTPVAETPVPCASAGIRKVLAEESYNTQAGSFEHCYQMSDFYNSGSPNRVFCEGVGFVAERYDHGGTRFGYAKELVTFSAGLNP